MTNNEAIEIIKKYNVFGCGYCHEGGDEIPEAFQMAVNALSKPSGIFIKGAKMPTGCFECPCRHEDVFGEFDSFCQAVEKEPTVDDSLERPEWCPLDEVK